MPFPDMRFIPSNLCIVVAYAEALVRSVIASLPSIPNSCHHITCPTHNPIPDRARSMNERRKIEERLRKKEEEIRGFETQIRDARIYVQALQDVLKLLPRGPERSMTSSALRPGSGVAKARECILSKGEPAHILELLRALGKEP